MKNIKLDSYLCSPTFRLPHVHNVNDVLHTEESICRMQVAGCRMPAEGLLAV
jgi:hypothetical protein